MPIRHGVGGFAIKPIHSPIRRRGRRHRLQSPPRRFEPCGNKCYALRTRARGVTSAAHTVCHRRTMEGRFRGGSRRSVAASRAKSRVSNPSHTNTPHVAVTRARILGCACAWGKTGRLARSAIGARQALSESTTPFTLGSADPPLDYFRVSSPSRCGSCPGGTQRARASKRSGNGGMHQTRRPTHNDRRHGFSELGEGDEWLNSNRSYDEACATTRRRQDRSYLDY